MAKFRLSDLDDSFPTTGIDTSGDDLVYARGGNDTIRAGLGANTVFGGVGDDDIQSDAATASQRYYGGAGNDYLLSGSGNDLLNGGAGDDVLVGNSGDATLLGEDGNDAISTGGISDTGTWYSEIFGGAGNDVLSSWASAWGNGKIYGGDGNDSLTARLHAAPTELSGYYGGSGQDRLTLWVDNSLTETTQTTILLSLAEVNGHQDLRINGAKVANIDGIETLEMNILADTVAMDAGAEVDNFTIRGVTSGVVSMGGGDDRLGISEASGVLVLDGGSGNDTLQFIRSSSADAVLLDLSKPLGVLVIGDAEAGSVTRFENLVFSGGDGDDVVTGGAGGDLIGLPLSFEDQEATDEAGNDSFSGGAGDDVIYAGFGDDYLKGDAGRDALSGGAGQDTLRGGSSDDDIIGDAGADSLYGGIGRDDFIFTAVTDSGVAAGTYDTITGFTVIKSHAGHIDRIDVALIDANTDVDGSDAFTFIGTAAFTAAGQIRVEEKDGSAYVQFNTGDTLDADMVIRLAGFDAATLGAEDFIL